MILSGKEIVKHMGKEIVIEPFDKSRVNPNSYNLSLYNELMVYDSKELDMAKPNSASVIKIPMLEGRSSVGRLGVFIHVTAGFGDVGFAGYWTLEIFCVQPIRIYPNVEICQIYYHDIDGEYDTYKSGKYQHNNGIQPSMLWKDFIK